MRRGFVVDLVGDSPNAGFTDLDGSRPDAWRHLVEVQDSGRPADVTGYR